MRPPPAHPALKAVLFDVFGTVVDWRGSIIREGEQVWGSCGVNVDWPAFADAWRSGYQPAIDRVREGQRVWVDLDVLHRELLDELLSRFGVIGLSEAGIQHLNRVWHRLTPWPDVVDGLLQLKQLYIIAPLSNGHVALLVNLAKHAGLPWDCILSSELAKRYKPDGEVYRHAVSLLDLMPHEVVMVAAHSDDLEAARSTGMMTAFVRRPMEFGAGQCHEQHAAGYDFIADDFRDLAQQLGAQVA